MRGLGLTAWLVCMCLACMVSAGRAQTDDSFAAQLIIFEIGPVPGAVQPEQPAARFAVNRVSDESPFPASYSTFSPHSGSSVDPPLVSAPFGGLSAPLLSLVVEFPVNHAMTTPDPGRSSGSAGPVLVAVVIIPDVPHRVPVRVTLGIRDDPGHSAGLSPLPAAQVYHPDK